MSEVLITLDVRIKPGLIDSFCAQAPTMIAQTREQPGFIAIRMVRHKTEPGRLLLVERWASELAYHDYIAWRTERGEMESFGELLEGAPKMEIWPALVVEA